MRGVKTGSRRKKSGKFSEIKNVKNAISIIKTVIEIQPFFTYNLIRIPPLSLSLRGLCGGNKGIYRREI